MITQSKKNPNSHLTVKERVKPSLPVKILHERGFLSGDVLDFGCGLGVDVQFLKSLNYSVIGYDPYYLPQYPENKFDTIICFYVLNVLLPEEQSQVLMAISELLKPSGKAYFAVRRDIKRNGFLYNPKKDAQTYQCNVVLPYKSIFKTENMELYEYQHYTVINKEIFKNSQLFSKYEDIEIITESALAFAIYDKTSNENKAYIFPKRQVNDFFDLTEKEQLACLMVLKRARKVLSNITSKGLTIKFIEICLDNKISSVIELLTEYQVKAIKK